MLCAKPFRKGVVEHGCGQCMPCRINRSRVWVSRIMLESTQHKYCWFVTLTYRPEKLPAGGNLEPRHLQLFMKLLRSYCADPVRFYAVGEYGERSGRPHYHLVVFGCDSDSHIKRAWTHGHVHIGSLTRESAGYICGYMLKGMTREGDARLNGKVPEFCRMSLKPGIGAHTAGAISQGLLSKGGSRALVDSGDVPQSIRLEGKVMPLGRYMRRKLREAVGWSPDTPDEVQARARLERILELQGDGAVLRERKREATDYSMRARVSIRRAKGKL